MERGRDVRWDGRAEPVEMSPCAPPCERRFSIGRRRPDLENICKVLSGRARPAARPSVAGVARDVRRDGLAEPIEMSPSAGPCGRRFSVGRRRPDLEKFGRVRRGWSVHPKGVRVTPAVYPARGRAALVGRRARPRRALGRARRAGRDEPMRGSVRATVLDRLAAAGLGEVWQSAQRVERPP